MASSRTHAAALLLIIAWAGEAAAQAITPAAQRGLIFVRTNCAQCHAIDKISPSPLTIAPPFRTLHTKYPIDIFGRGVRRRHRHRPSVDAGISA